MTEVAKAAGLGRESLYKALAAGARPEWATVIKVLGALGLSVAIIPTPGTRPKRPRKAA
jgi:probable addiction module antidote protein